MIDEQQSDNLESIHAGTDRRQFMKRMLVGTGAAAFAAMAGSAALSSATGANAAEPTPSPSPSPGPGGPGGPGAPGGQPQVNDVTDDFLGLTTDGKRLDDLYAVHSTKVSTAPIKAAAEAFLATLTADQKKAVQFGVYSLEWRRWSNVDMYVRSGVKLSTLADAQKTAGLGLLTAGLSARGLKLTENIRRINGIAGKLLDKPDRFHEEAYFITIMGTPSDTEPWGWQFEGHHLAINYFVLGDQVVMTPTFLGSEPTSVTDPDTKTEIRVFDEELAAGLALVNSLDSAQKTRAIVSATKPVNNAIAEAFKDNTVSPYAGLRANAMTRAQQTTLLTLVERFIGNTRPDHAAVKMREIREHLADTYFSWVGATDEKAVFYFRIQSPVIFIEFDCEGPGPIGSVYGGTNNVPSRMHIHSVIRTPNGNDYGKELLRLHYLTSPHHN